jgi:serine/threonine protein kinase
MPVPVQPPKSILGMLKGHAGVNEELKDLQVFADFLEKCLSLDASRRISPEEALYHPFINLLKKTSTGETVASK